MKINHRSKFIESKIIYTSGSGDVSGWGYSYGCGSRNGDGVGWVSE